MNEDEDEALATADTAVKLIEDGKVDLPVGYSALIFTPEGDRVCAVLARGEDDRDTLANEGAIEATIAYVMLTQDNPVVSALRRMIQEQIRGEIKAFRGRMKGH